MGALKTTLKRLREVTDGAKAGTFDFEGGVEVLATLGADLQAAYATEKARTHLTCTEFKVHN